MFIFKSSPKIKQKWDKGCRKKHFSPLLRYNWYGYNRHSIPLFCQNFPGLAHLHSGLGFGFPGRNTVVIGTIVIHQHWGQFTVGWHMHITKCCFSNTTHHTIGSRLFDGLNLHEQSCLLSACYMEGCVTVRLMTLNACSWTSLLADVACQLLTCRWNAFQAVNGFQKHCVSKTHLWNPEGTHNVGPAPIICLFKSTTLIRAQHAVNCTGGGLQAAATQPLSFRDVGHSVALLMNGQIAHITEQDDVAVLTLSIHADGAHRILINRRALVFASSLALEECLLLKAVHQSLKGLLWNCGSPITIPLFIQQFQPRMVLRLCGKIN